MCPDRHGSELAARSSGQQGATPWIVQWLLQRADGGGRHGQRQPQTRACPSRREDGLAWRRATWPQTKDTPPIHPGVITATLVEPRRASRRSDLAVADCPPRPSLLHPERGFARPLASGIKPVRGETAEPVRAKPKSPTQRATPNSRTCQCMGPGPRLLFAILFQGTRNIVFHPARHYGTGRSRPLQMTVICLCPPCRTQLPRQALRPSRN